MKNKLMLFGASLIAVVGVFAGLAVGGNNPPGQDPCSHGATGKPCKPDPQPNHGKDCLHHGKKGGVNEDHCAGTTTGTTTTGNTTTVGTTTNTQTVTVSTPGPTTTNTQTVTQPVQTVTITDTDAPKPLPAPKKASSTHIDKKTHRTVHVVAHHIKPKTTG